METVYTISEDWDGFIWFSAPGGKDKSGPFTTFESACEACEDYTSYLNEEFGWRTSCQ